MSHIRALKGSFKGSIEVCLRVLLRDLQGAFGGIRTTSESIVPLPPL